MSGHGAGGSGPTLPPIPSPPPDLEPEDRPSALRRVWRLILGAPRDLRDRSLFHHLSLVALLAWVGLGADGLSSSSYGPSEAFHALGQHTYLAVGLAVLTAITIFVISGAYRYIIEAFPHGGGGYLVASKLLGPRTGVVSGCALLVDYVLTITVSIAAAGDALFSFMPVGWNIWKLPSEILLILGLALLNLRGVKESVMTLLPIFVLFVVTHLFLIVGGIVTRIGEIPATAVHVHTGFQQGLATLGAGGLLLLFLHAYSLGGGTYTGLEAVSNGLPLMREPRVQTGKRTMVYMSTSLAFMAGGLILCYLLWGIVAEPGKTMNAVLAERFAAGLPLAQLFVILTLVSEGALLVVGAQAGYIGGPRVLANMALDSWMPRRFASLSDRLTTQNGVLLMAAMSLVALIYTGGAVRHLVVMYSINVFLTFTLSMYGMLRDTLRRREERDYGHKIATFLTGLVFCVTILAITIITKFREGGWITLAVAAVLIVLCFLIHRHYEMVGAKLHQLFRELASIPRTHTEHPGEVNRREPVAVVLVGGYGGLGIHTTLSALNFAPTYFRGIVFVGVGVIDSGGFKGADAVDRLTIQTRRSLEQYVALAHGVGVRATYRMAVGTDAVAELERLCLQISREFARPTFFAGKILFQRDRWYQRVLHNETAFALERRLQWAGLAVTVLPARVR